MKVIVLFNGQGGGHSTLYELLKQDKATRAYLSEASTLLNMDLLAPEVPTTDPRTCQLLIGVYQLGMFSLLKELLQNQDITLAGYSLGEVVAFLVSTGANLTTAIQTLQYRTNLMLSVFKDGNSIYDLLSIRGGVDLNKLEALCVENHCAIAIINSDDHFVVGGEIDNLQKLSQQLSDSRGNLQFLSIKVPSHTSYYTNQSPLLAQFLSDQFAHASLCYPILNALDGKRIKDASQEINILGQELSSRLNWQKVCQLLPEYGYELVIDLGPGSAQTALLKQSGAKLHRQKIITVSDFKTVEGLKDYLTK